MIPPPKQPLTLRVELSAAMLATVPIEGAPLELLSRDRRVLVFSRIDALPDVYEGFPDYEPVFTKLTVLDFDTGAEAGANTDSTPRIERELYLEGEYVFARQQGGVVRAVNSTFVPEPGRVDPGALSIFSLDLDASDLTAGTPAVEAGVSASAGAPPLSSFTVFGYPYGVALDPGAAVIHHTRRLDGPSEAPRGENQLHLFELDGARARYAAAGSIAGYVSPAFGPATAALVALDLSSPAAPRETGRLPLPSSSGLLWPVQGARLLSVASVPEPDETGSDAELWLFDVGDASAPGLGVRYAWPPTNTVIDDPRTISFSPDGARLGLPVTGAFTSSFDVFDLSASGLTRVASIVPDCPEPTLVQCLELRGLPTDPESIAGAGSGRPPHESRHLDARSVSRTCATARARSLPHSRATARSQGAMSTVSVPAPPSSSQDSPTTTLTDSPSASSMSTSA